MLAKFKTLIMNETIKEIINRYKCEISETDLTITKDGQTTHFKRQRDRYFKRI